MQTTEHKNQGSSAKLLDEIIQLLSDEKTGTLSTALLKTKVLLHQIGKKELAEWVNHELNGYPDAEAIPEYRILPSQVLANVCNIAYQASNHPIPIGHLKPKIKANFEKSRMTQSLAVLEELASKKKGALTRPIPMEANGLLSKGLANDFQVQSAWCTTQVHDVIGILTQVRSRLLDFVLEFKAQLGDANSENNIKEKAAAIGTSDIFHHAIFGANATIIVGNHNTQNAHTGISDGNLDALLKTLATVGVPPKEIKKLETAVTEDEKNGGKVSFAGKTGKWLTEFMSSVAKGSIQAGSKALSGDVVNAITSYIGSSGINL